MWFTKNENLIIVILKSIFVLMFLIDAYFNFNVIIVIFL